MADFVDKTKHKAEELVGRTRKSLGKATGDKFLEREGRRGQVSGNVKRFGDDITDAVKHVRDKFKK